MNTAHMGQGLKRGVWLLIALALTATVAIVAYSVGASEATYDLQAQKSAERAASDSRERIGHECAGLSAAALYKCEYAIIDTAQQRQRDAYNLDAQQQQGGGIKWFLLIAGLELVVTGVGLYFLSRNLEATDRSNEITRQASELDFRPIMAFIGLEMRQGPRGFFYLKPVWRNIGKLPALPIEAVIRRTYIDGRQTSEEDVERLLRENEGHVLNEFEITTTGGHVQGPEIAMEYNKLQIHDQFPNGIPRAEGVEIGWRYRAMNQMLVIATLRYKVAVGNVEREWKTENVLPYTPFLDDEGIFLPPDRWGIAMGIQNRIRMT